MPQRAHHRRSSDLDLLRLREANGWRYLTRLRPAVVVLGLLIAVVSAIVQPGEVVETDLVLVGWSLVVTIAAILLARRIAILPIVNATIVLDVVLLYRFIGWSDQPQTTVMVLLWPIIAFAYFAGPGTALLASLLASASCFWLQASDVHWTDERGVPGAAYIMLISGLLIWFVTGEGRRIEHALARDRLRSRRALLLAQRIRLSDDPHASLEEIAREVGVGTTSDRMIVGLFEHDAPHLADLVTWDASSARVAPSPIRTAVDATILNLAASGAGIVCDGENLIVRANFVDHADTDGGCDHTPDAGAVQHALRESFALREPHSCVLCPLMIGDRAIGFLLALSSTDPEWSDAAAPLLASLAPQLAAGLAQVVLVRDQRDALDALERVNEMRDRLIASVSHELRTPLTSTIGFVETLLREDVELSPQTRAELLQHARDGGQRLLSLVEDLLTLGTTRPESLDLQRQPMQVRDLVAAAVIGIDLPDGRDLRLTTRREARAVIDRNRMLQVVTNLVVNAARHGAGVIEVVCDADERDAIIDVLDNGPGIRPEHVRELFLPFASFSSRTDSTGLGLAICRTIVEAHGGTIAYSRTEDHRTRFRVRIPAS